MILNSKLLKKCVWVASFIGPPKNNHTKLTDTPPTHPPAHPPAQQPHLPTFLPTRTQPFLTLRASLLKRCGVMGDLGGWVGVCVPDFSQAGVRQPRLSSEADHPVQHWPRLKARAVAHPTWPRQHKKIGIGVGLGIGIISVNVGVIISIIIIMVLLVVVLLVGIPASPASPA